MDSNQKLVDAQTKLMDKCLELAVRSRQSTPRPVPATRSCAAELLEQSQSMQAPANVKEVPSSVERPDVSRPSSFRPIQPAVTAMQPVVGMDGVIAPQYTPRADGRAEHASRIHQPTARRNTSSQTRELIEDSDDRQPGGQKNIAPIRATSLSGTRQDNAPSIAVTTTPISADGQVGYL